MRSSSFTILKALPLIAAFFTIAADGEACHIIIDDGGDDNNVACPDLQEICPDLVCETGSLIDADGCPSCECAPICDATRLEIPDCANPSFDESTCTWTCDDTQACASDSDCRSGVCLDGLCVDVSNGCFADEDCGPGFRCDFGGAAGGGTGNDPAPGRPDIAPAGQCVPVSDEQGCSSDEECRPGQHCEFLDATNGLVARAGKCVDDTVVGCSSDADCAAGEVCGFVRPAGDRPCFDANGDGSCDDAPPPPADGVCVPAPVDGNCASDVDCAAGETCKLLDGCVCTQECREDGNGGCLPCECPVSLGVCVPTDVVTPCFSDADCSDTEQCVADPTNRPDTGIAGTCQARDNTQPGRP